MTSLSSLRSDISYHFSAPTTEIGSLLHYVPYVSPTRLALFFVLLTADL